MALSAPTVPGTCSRNITHCCAVERVQEELALQPSPLAPLHNHRRVLGVIGVMHCPNVDDVSKAYAQFEQRCK